MNNIISTRLEKLKLDKDLLTREALLLKCLQKSLLNDSNIDDINKYDFEREFVFRIRFKILREYNQKIWKMNIEPLTRERNEFINYFDDYFEITKEEKDKEKHSNKVMYDA